MTQTPPGINAQLRAFYDAQGLTGQHRRRALQYDRRRIREEAIRATGRPCTPTCPGTDSIAGAFVWYCSTEGHWFWMIRHEVAGGAL